MIQYHLKENYQNILSKLMMIVLTFFSAFRYGMTADYFYYVKLFETDNLLPNIEPTSCLLVIGLKTLGFDFQIIFFIFSILTSFFLWVGLRYYLKDWMQMTIAIVIYSLMLEGYWMTLSQIRQFLAIAIFVFAVDLFLKGNSLST